MSSGLVRPVGPLDDVLGGEAVASAGLGTFGVDLQTGALAVDDRLRTLLELAAGAGLADVTARVPEEDRDRARERLGALLAADATRFEHEMRLLLPSGVTRWVVGHGAVVRDGSGRAVRLVGVAWDATLRRPAEAHLARVIEAMPTALFSLDRAWRFTYINAEAERLFGMSRTEVLGGVLWDLFPHSVGSTYEQHYRGAVATGRPVVFEVEYPETDRWFEARAWPTPDGLTVYYEDVSTRRRAAALAEREARRTALLAQVTTGVTETLDQQEALERLARALVPALADWCLVSLVEDDDGTPSSMRDVGWAHADAALEPLVRRYAELRVVGRERRRDLLAALTTGEVLRLDSGATAVIERDLPEGEARALMSALAPESVVVFALRGRGRTTGVVTLFSGAERGAPAEEDLAVARELATRVGLALDNMRLHAEQVRLAEGLQLAMLSDPPPLPGAQVAVRYVPAARAARVGGDWYDVFLQRDGAPVVVIGDVVGHDTLAAAAMGQLRSLLRGVGVVTGSGPAALLADVDRAMLDLGSPTVATAVALRLEDATARGGEPLTTVRWSTAGHPAPLVLHTDGRVEPLAAEGWDILLGVAPESRRTESAVDLPAGTTLLLYTDGLVERRTRPLGEGLEALADALRAAGPLPLDDLCDHVLAALLPDAPEDDVAVVALRLGRAPGAAAQPPAGLAGSHAAPAPAERAELRLEPRSGAAGLARRWVRELLGPSADAAALRVVELLVSELVTNAVKYGGPLEDVLVTAEVADDVLTVAVTDANPEPPQVRHAELSATGGRGMALVDRLAQAWGVDIDGASKTVWFRSALRP